MILRLARWGGLAAIVGGAMFAVLAFVIASLPEGSTARNLKALVVVLKLLG